MVQGGLPVGSSVVLQGPPGQEKLRFALTFLADGLKSGASGLVVTSSQSPDAILAELRDLGVDLDSVTKENRLRVVDWYSWSEETVHDIEERGIVMRSSIDLTNLGVALSRAIAALARGQPPRAVIELLSPATSTYEVTQVYAFAQSAKRKFDRHEFTSLVLLENEMHSGPQLTTLHQPFDGVIEIERTRSGDRIVRKIGVLHLKDTAPDPTFRVLEISVSGMRVVQDSSKSAAAASSARGGVLESQDERAQRLRLILQIATERLKLNPRDADALFAMAAAQATLDDAKGGLQTLDRLADLDAAYPGLWVLKTKLHAKLGQGELARESRLRAQQTEPEAAKAIDATVPCPMCEAPVAIDATSCANCGVKFTPTRTLEEELDDLGHAAIQEIVQEELAAEPKTESKHPTPPVPKPATKAPVKPSSKRGMTNGLVLQRGASRRAGMTNGLKGRTNGLRGRTNGLTNGRGRTNGLTNGVGRTNGLTNGVGRTNGLTDGLGRTNGLTNGLGRTNGITNGLGRTNGLTNGLGGVRPAGFHSSGVRGTMRNAGWKLYLIPLVVVLLLFVPLFLVPEYQGPAYPIQIDGQFGDWNGVSRLSVTSAAANPDIDITQVAVKDNLDYLSFYIGVRGLALNGGPSPGRVTNAFYAFIDVDRSASTGYQVQGIGADRMVRINTWGGQVVSSGLLVFNTSRGPTDWNGWVSIGPVYAAGSADRIEFETPWLDVAQNPVPVDVAFASRSWDGQSDAADLVATNAEPFVLVTQVTSAPAVASGSGTSLAQITLRAVNGTVAVHAVNVTFTGTFGPSSISTVDLVDATSSVLSTQPIAPVVHFGFSPITLASGDTRTFSMRPHVFSPDGTTVGAFVRDVEDVVVSGGGVAFVGPRTTPASLAYVGFVPSGPRIDGGFGEWTNLTPDPMGDVQPVWNPDIDFSAYGFRGYQNDTYFEGSVVGTALNGTMVPALNPTFTPPSSGAGNGTVGPTPSPVNGTDFIRFFLDADGNASTGYRIGGLGADYLVEITGKNGLILSALAMRFSGASPYDWKWSSLGPAQAAKDQAHIEAELRGVLITNVSRAYFEASAWNGAHDDSGAPNPPLAVFSIMSAQSSSMNTQSTTAPSPSGSFNLQAQVLPGNQQWFFTNGAASGGGNPSDCSPASNNFGASTTAGASATSTTLTSGQAICWYTPIQTPASTTAGTWEFNLDISGSGTSPKYRTQIMHCGGAGCQSSSLTVLYDANYTTFGTNVTITTPAIAAQVLAGNDRIEFKISWNGGSGSTVTISYNGPSPIPGTSDSWASLPVYAILAGNQQWFFTNGSPVGGGNLLDCSPNANNFAASLTAGSGATSTALASSQSICWYTPTGTPAATSAGAWQFNLDISSSGTNPKYRVQIFHCGTGGCGASAQTILYDANYTTFGTNVTITTPAIAAQVLAGNDRIEFKISWNGGSGSTVTISYNGPSPIPGTSDSWASIPIPEFSDLAVPIAFATLVPIVARRRLCKRKKSDASES